MRIFVKIDTLVINKLRKTYEYHFFLQDPNHKASLDWRTRYKIISGITAGLSYMHHDSRVRTIHRDFKTGNILLDEDMNPKISDFGLYKILSGNETGETAKKVSGTP